MISGMAPVLFVLILALFTVPRLAGPKPIVPGSKTGVGPILNNGTYTCPKSEWVDCMPTIGLDKSSQCGQSYLDWVRANCPNFKGVAY
jgi:hypothetical protein